MAISNMSPVPHDCSQALQIRPRRLPRRSLVGQRDVGIIDSRESELTRPEFVPLVPSITLNPRLSEDSAGLFIDVCTVIQEIERLSDLRGVCYLDGPLA